MLSTTTSSRSVVAQAQASVGRNRESGGTPAELIDVGSCKTPRDGFCRVEPEPANLF